MGNYTKLSISALEDIAALYGIHLTGASPMKGGNSNTSYRLETITDTFVLTILEENTLEEVEQLAHLLKYLQDHSFCTSQVQRTKAGELTFTYMGKPLLLKKWIVGEVYEKLTLAHIAAIGQTLAHFHQIPRPPNLTRAYSCSLQMFPTVFDLQIDPTYEHWLKDRWQYLQNHLPSNSPKGLIHADLFFDNVLFQDNQLKAIIDFEDACHYYLGFDLGMSIIGLCQVKDNIDLNLAKAFLQGYRKIHPLPVLEKAHLKLFVEYAAIATSFWRFRKYHILSPKPARKNKHREMMALAQQINAFPADYFSSRLEG